MTRSLDVALLGTLLSGCVATSGREWLNAPVEERAATRSADVVFEEAPTDARPRLRRTITLGESYASAAPSRTPGGSATAPSVQVNVQTQVPVVVNHYGGYGYGLGYGYGYGYGVPVRSSAGVSAGSSGSSQKVGADWPAVPDYGPRPMR